MGEPQLALLCYHVDGSFSDVFVKDCNFDREPFPDCIEIECMSLKEWFEEDCEATDFPMRKKNVWMP